MQYCDGWGFELALFGANRDGRRGRTRRALRQQGIDIPSSLPPIDVETRVRSDADLVHRAACLYATGVRGYGRSADEVESVLRDNDLLDAMAPSELQYIRGAAEELGPADCAIESFWVALWALGIYPRLDLLAAQCPDDVAEYRPLLSRPTGLNDFAASARVRPDSELADALDLAYCVDWAAIDDRVHGRSRLAVQTIETGCRRRLLEWLFSDDEWDDLSLDT